MKAAATTLFPEPSRAFRPPVAARRTLRQWLFASAAALAMATYAPAAFAFGGPAPQTQRLIESHSVFAPRAFTQLCARSPEICAAEQVADATSGMADAMARMFGSDALRFAPPVLTPERMEMLKQVNTAVNTTIHPREDRGADHWELNWRSGDCEEYVLMKREMLARMGWPRTALRITVVRDFQGYHAVLVVETDQGGFVLDNMVEHITTVSGSPYEFVVAQSVERPGEWVRVSKG
ncbi:MAG: transglutaminase-like cysteine peptidase [Pseudomonadota bacterium]